jgi:hypothetical protein
VSYYEHSHEACPKCGGDTHQDSADIGVGVIYGPRGCVECGWSESEEYDMTIEANRKPDSKGGYKDQFGGYHPAGSTVAMAYRLADGSQDG